jgi:hypothetical protein
MIIDITTHSDWEPCEGPYGQATGWYRPRGSQAKVFAAGAVVHDDAAICGGTIYDGTIVGGAIMGGTVRGGTIRGGTIMGGTIECGTIEGGIIVGGTPPYAHALRWQANISSPDRVTVGCQAHSIADWLREDEGSPVPWSVHCTDAERTIIVGVIRVLDMQMQAGVCDWRAE